MENLIILLCDEDAKTKKCNPSRGIEKLFDLAYSNIPYLTMNVDPTIKSLTKMCESKPEAFKNSTHSIIIQ